MTRGRFLAVMASGGAAFYLTACGGDTSGDGSSAGKKVAGLDPDKGEVNLITFETYHDKPWLEQYTATTGTKINAITAGSVDEMFAKARSGTVPLDIGYFDLGSVGRYIKAGLIQPFDISQTANIKNVAKNLAWKKPLTIEGKLWGAPYNWGTQPLMWDASEIASDPNSWDILWDPTYKRRVTMPDDSYIGIPMVALARGVKDPYNMTDADFETVSTALSELRPQLKTLTTGYNDAENLYGAGDAVVGYCQFVAVVNALNEKGRNFKYGYPSKTPFWIDSAILFNGGNRKEVYDFINKGLSVKWQSRFIEESGSTGVISAEVAKRTVPPAALEATEIGGLADPEFQSLTSALAPQNEVDRRLEVWNEFKAGL